jgi:hypothetical protein
LFQFGRTKWLDNQDLGLDSNLLLSTMHIANMMNH